jgi:diguanylate cyclase (GGDEF)-like protein
VSKVSRWDTTVTLDLSAYLRLGLGAVAGGFLAASVLVVLFRERKSRPAGAYQPAAGGLLLILDILLTVRSPSFAPAGVPVLQMVLLLAGGALLAAALVHPARAPEISTRHNDPAAVDSLTGLASHRTFHDRLEHECERAYRFGDSFMVALLDLDDFHPVNNRHGHRAGDKILVELARRLSDQVREIDLVARFGGDQFGVIFPHTFEKGGLEVAERLRQSIAGWLFLAPDKTELRVTASVGLCSYPDDGASPPEIVRAGEEALLFAKSLGGNQVQLARQIAAQESLENMVSFRQSGRAAVVRSLAAAVSVRDHYTHEHEEIVSDLAAAIARRIGLPGPDVDRIQEAALLHDVGKIGVPDAILSKEGSLTQNEWEKIRQHPVLGKHIIEKTPELHDLMPLVLHHQEHFDGSGYPERLRGEQIPLGARIIAAADAYHAIRSHRPYRSGRTHDEASQELRRCAGGQFDPRIITALFQVLADHPSLAELGSGEVRVLTDYARTVSPMT